MTHYDRLKRKRLGDILVDEHLASEEVVITALQEQQRTGRLLSDILLQMQEVGEYDLARVVVEQYQTPFIELKSYAVHKDLIELFTPDFLHRSAVVPLDRFGRQICFACQEVPSKEVADELKRQSPGGIYIYIASAIEIRQILHDYAPLSEAGRKALAKTAASPTSAGKPFPGDPEEDTAWKELFDAANESILTDLTTPDD
jgi:hypothetical protein